MAARGLFSTVDGYLEQVAEHKTKDPDGILIMHSDTAMAIVEATGDVDRIAKGRAAIEHQRGFLRIGKMKVRTVDAMPRGHIHRDVSRET